MCAARRLNFPVLTLGTQGFLAQHVSQRQSHVTQSPNRSFKPLYFPREASLLDQMDFSSVVTLKFKYWLFGV